VILRTGRRRRLVRSALAAITAVNAALLAVLALALAVPLPDRRGEWSAVLEYRDGTPAYVWLARDDKWRLPVDAGRRQARDRRRRRRRPQGAPRARGRAWRGAAHALRQTAPSTASRRSSSIERGPSHAPPSGEFADKAGEFTPPRVASRGLVIVPRSARGLPPSDTPWFRIVMRLSIPRGSQTKFPSSSCRVSDLSI
jgi:hypothetical protein